MAFDKWFNNQGLLLKFILLIIPVVGWVVELLVRLSVMLRTKSLVHILVFILFVVFGWGIVLQIVDFIVLVVTGHLLLAD